jgi:flavin reductase (DIM6/NTAB) family NADH-FMN oxidoreductase RutF
MDPAIKKTALRLFTYGLYAVTAKHGDELSAMTVNWIIQSSFEPPLIALAVESDSHSRQVIEAAGAFAVNVYETGEREFAGSLGRTYAKHPDKITGLDTKPGPATGSPLLNNALAWVECKIISQTASGDHILFIAEVVEVGINREGVPLTLKETGFKYAG